MGFSSAAVDGILFRFASWRLERLSASNLKFKRTLVDIRRKSVRGNKVIELVGVVIQDVLYDISHICVYRWGERE